MIEVMILKRFNGHTRANGNLTLIFTCNWLADGYEEIICKQFVALLIKKTFSIIKFDSKSDWYGNKGLWETKKRGT